MNDEQFERLMNVNREEAQELRRQVWESTGITLDENDQSIAMFLVHHRFLEAFYQKQGEIDHQKAKEIFTALSPLINEMRDTVDLIESKHTTLQKDINTLNAFKDEMIVFFTTQATENAHNIVANEIKEQVLNNLKHLNTKTHWVLMSVLMLQMVMVILLLFMVLK